MSVDCNKTDLTRQITDAASRWLDERGFKPVESEVPITDGWVADLAGVAEFTATEAINMKLLRKSPRYTVSENYRAEYEIWRDEFMSIPCPTTALVEVKASKSDFTRDSKWEREPVAHLMYVAMPQDLRQQVTVPPAWGVLVQVGEQVRCVRPAPLSMVPSELVLRTTLAIAVRRDHFTRYERFREFSRQARARDKDRETAARVATVCGMAHGLVKGRYATVEDAMRASGIKRLPKYVQVYLSELIPTPKEPTHDGN